MTSFVEKIVAEIVVSLCVGAALGLISGLYSVPEQALRQNRRRVCHCGGSDALIEGKPDQVPLGDEHR
jgi:hypothetical protein